MDHLDIPKNAAQPCETHQDNAEKIAVCETNIEDMLQAIQARLDELEGKELTDFEQGRQLAFTEMLDIIRTRHKVILDVLECPPNCSTDESEHRITPEFLIEAMAEYEKAEKSGTLRTLRLWWNTPVD